MAKIIMLSKAGHITKEDGFKTLPIALDEIKKMITKQVIRK